MVGLGVIQIVVAYYNSHLTIEALPQGVSQAKRTRYRLIFLGLVVAIGFLTLLLAKFNDAHQYQAELALQQERAKQDVLQSRLDQTLNAITASQSELDLIRNAVTTHHMDQEMPSMLHSLDMVQKRLAQQAASMRMARPQSTPAYVPGFNNPAFSPPPR